jgi:hypothetical protein
MDNLLTAMTMIVAQRMHPTYTSFYIIPDGKVLNGFINRLKQELRYIGNGYISGLEHVLERFQYLNEIDKITDGDIKRVDKELKNGRSKGLLSHIMACYSVLCSELEAKRSNSKYYLNPDQAAIDDMGFNGHR